MLKILNVTSLQNIAVKDNTDSAIYNHNISKESPYGSGKKYKNCHGKNA